MLKPALALLALAAAAFGTYLLVEYAGRPAPPPIPLYMEELVSEAAEKAEERVAATMGGGKRLLLLPVRGDTTVEGAEGNVTRILRLTLSSGARFSVVVPRPEKKDDSLTGLLSEAIKRAISPAEAATLFKRYDVDFILACSSDSSDTAEEARFVLRLAAETPEKHVEMGEVTCSMSKSLFSPRYFSVWMRSSSVPLRALCYLLFVALLPWALYPLLARVLARERNLFNGLALACLTAAGSVCCFTLLGLTFSGFFAAAVFVLNLPFSFLYSWWALDKIERLRR